MAVDVQPPASTSGGRGAWWCGRTRLPVPSDVGESGGAAARRGGPLVHEMVGMKSDDEAGRGVVRVSDSGGATRDMPRVARAVGAAARVSPGVVAAVCGAAIAVLVVAGILQRTAFPDWGAANLDSEVSVATRFSAALLWAAALWWLLVAVAARPRQLVLWFWWPLLAWLALDEGAAIHEGLERWSGIDWQVLYLPVMALGALAWLGVAHRYRRRPRMVALLMAAAAAWVAVLALELGQNWGGSPVDAAIYDPVMIIEEALEMIGSTSLLVAGTLALRDTVREVAANDE